MKQHLIIFGAIIFFLAGFLALIMLGVDEASRPAAIKDLKESIPRVLGIFILCGGFFGILHLATKIKSS